MSSIFNTPGTKRKVDISGDPNGAYESTIQPPPSKRPRGVMASPSAYGPVVQTMADSVKLNKRTHKKKTVAAQTVAPVVNTAVYFRDNLPWLTRRQTLPDQNLWLLHYRDNLVPGATNPKSGPEVTKEFNLKFKDVLKKELVWKTLQKRISTTRKQFYIDNPEYEAAIKYPPNSYEDQEVPDETLGGVDEDEVLDEQTIVPDRAQQDLVQPFAPPQKHLEPTLSGIREQSVMNESFPLKAHIQISGLGAVTPVHAIPAIHPGAPSMSSISSTQILPTDRAHFHLRRRSESTVAFRLLDSEEDEGLNDRDDVQFVDHALLLTTSPAYARFAHSNPDSPVCVPEDFSANTVNAFIQIISPLQSQHLPTHYLWNSKKPVPGQYDRFGGVEAEKIIRTVDALLQLQAFARQMEVMWICDMLTDRLYWMFLEQTKLRDMCRNVMIIKGKGIPHLPSVPNLEDSGIAADDFSTEVLDALVAEPLDVPTLRFVAELMHALHGAPDEEWFDEQQSSVQVIFERSAVGGRLIDASREEFCERYHYHHHSTCYTANSILRIPRLVQQVYATSSHKDLINLSKHLSPETELKSVVHKASGAAQSLKELNSSPTMLDTEKMILEMEMRLQEAKDAASRARDASAEDKARATARAKKVAEDMFTASDVMQQ